MERNDWIGTINFAYDSKNRVTSFISQKGSASYFMYDDENRPIFIERYPDIKNQGYEIFFNFYYSSGSNDFIMTANSRNEKDVETTQYNEFTADTQRRITGFKEFNYPNLTDPDREYVYNYTDGNYTSIITTTGNQVVTSLYEYDTHPNPLYGMPGPGNLLGFFTFSHNNITKGGTALQGGSIKTSFEYTYEYNNLGLPVSAINKYGPERFRFIYETY